MWWFIAVVGLNTVTLAATASKPFAMTTPIRWRHSLLPAVRVAEDVRSTFCRSWRVHERARILVSASDSDGLSASVSWREQSEPETVVPDVSLTRSRDGSTGTATFTFGDPSCLSLNDVWENGLITGLWLRDEEGVLVTTDLDVQFERGRPHKLVAILVLKSSEEWDRFMRFMRRYAEQSGLTFEPSNR